MTTCKWCGLPEAPSQEEWKDGDNEDAFCWRQWNGEAECFDIEDALRSKAPELRDEALTARAEVARLTAEVEAMRGVVEAATLACHAYFVSDPEDAYTGYMQHLEAELAKLHTVPGDALAPCLCAELSGRCPRHDRITAALEASGIDTGNVKEVE